MEQASRTALGAAMHRAAHQLLDVPPVFADPLALRIIGPEAEGALRTGDDPRFARAGLRAFVAARSRFAEDGLAEAGIAIPASVVYAAVDFDREPAAVALARAGFDAARPAYFAWLGVTPYLTREAVVETLGFVAGLGGGSEIVFDYAERPVGGEGALGRAHQALAARVAAVGEPFRSEFEPAALGAEARRLGFSDLEDLGAEALNARYFQGRGDGLRLLGRGRLLRARL